MGPAVGESNDLYFLRNEPWLEFRTSTLKQCKEDGVIPWVRSGSRGAMLECEDLGLDIIIGPNCVFSDSNNPEANRRDLESDAVVRLLMSDYDNMALAKTIAKHPDRLKQVPYFMRPSLYEEPLYFKHEWDLYVHIKTSVNKFIRGYYPNHTATHHGWYVFKELRYKAQHSKVCLHACHYDNYGVAIHEISLLGCPVVYDKFGFKTGTIGEGMGIEVPDVNGEDVKIIAEAVKEAMAMDRRKVWEASRAFQDPERLKKLYRESILF